MNDCLSGAGGFIFCFLDEYDESNDGVTDWQGVARSPAKYTLG